MSLKSAEYKELDIEYHGVHPYIQGYWVRQYGGERKPPKWLPGHDNETFKREWMRGYDARDKRGS